MSITPDRRWMHAAERLNYEDCRAQPLGYAMTTIYYGGGGVYSVAWGTRRRGASEARAWIEEYEPEFARRVSLAAGMVDRTPR